MQTPLYRLCGAEDVLRDFHYDRCDHAHFGTGTTKEIGTLRTIVTSKQQGYSMLNAETLIIRIVSGALDVLITYLLCISINIILHNLTGISSLNAILPVHAAVTLVLISMLLTLIAGIFLYTTELLKFCLHFSCFKNFLIFWNKFLSQIDRLLKKVLPHEMMEETIISATAPSEDKNICMRETRSFSS